ncbi:MAG: multidrug effflux MFS transporter [Acidimicrobiales bacterium]|nr:multidrug effflux MFS transporter [Acidimicrobiales bacterium]
MATTVGTWARRGAAPGSREFLAIVTTCMGASALSIDLLLPALPDMRADFGLAPGDTEISRIITGYFLGLALGQLVYGPMSDRYGRRRMLQIGMAVFVVGAVASVAQTSLAGLVACRFVWGLGAAAPRSLSVAMVRDTFQGDAMARTMSLIMATFVLIPIFAPAVGAGVLAVAPWRGVLWLQAGIGLALALWSVRLPETLHEADRRSVSPRSLAVAARTVFRNRQTLSFALAITASFGILTSYIGTSEVIIDEVFGEADRFPLIFGVLACPLAVGSLVAARIVSRIGLARLVRAGAAYLLIAGLALAGVAIATDGRPSLWAFGLAIALLLPAVTLVIPSSNTAAMAPLGQVAGMGAAIVGTVSTAGGALLGTLADGAFDGTMQPFALHVAAYCAIATLAILLLARGPTPRTGGIDVITEPVSPA